MSEDDEQFNQSFGEHTGISKVLRNYINDARQLSSPRAKSFSLYHYDTRRFTNQAWRLLGRYIANNNRLEKVDLQYFIVVLPMKRWHHYLMN